MRKLIVLTATVFGLAPHSAHAQNCLGFATFAAGVVGLGAKAYGAPGVSGAVANVNLGRPASAFGGASIGLQNVNISSNPNSDFLVSSMGLGVNAGYELLLGRTQHLSVCPLASIGHRFGPNYASGAASVRESGNDYAAEVAFGGAVKLGRKVDLVPSILIGFAGWTYTAAVVGGASNSGTNSALEATFSVGVVIADRFSIRPFVSVSSQENSDPAIGVSFRAQLGQKQ